MKQNDWEKLRAHFHTELEAEKMREFDTGATRDTEEGKPDYEGYFSPLAMARFARYMMKHQEQADHAQRSSDNWQKGIPLTAYMKSAWRHFMDWWTLHRQAAVGASTEEVTDALCALLFNVMGYLHEIEKRRAEAPHFYPASSDDPAVASDQIDTGLGIPVQDIMNLTEEEKRRVLKAMDAQRDTGGRH